MSNYVIAIGGTGARFLESLIHLAATGILSEKISAIIIDPDNANGNVKRVEEIFEASFKEKVTSCKKIFLAEDRQIFRTSMDFHKCPLVGEKETLKKYLDLENLDLWKLFYKEKEINEEWGHGFKQRAHLGAPVMANIALDKDPWRSLINGVAGIRNTLNTGRCNIFVVGSIFGATGASGFPNIATLLRRQAKDKKWPTGNLRIGGCLLFPYFSFPSAPEGHKGLSPDPKDFLINTQGALYYYTHIWKKRSPYNRLYLLGDTYTHQQFEKFVPGGEDQTNPLSYIDLIAATAFLHFIKNPSSVKKDGRYSSEYYYSGREEGNKITWEDIPLGQELKKGIMVFSVFVYSYMRFIAPLIADKKFEKKSVSVPWYAAYFDGGELEEIEKNNGPVEKYMKYFHRFIHEIHNTTNSDKLKIRLFDKGKLEKDLKEVDFGRLLEDKEIANSVDKIFDILCKGNWEGYREKKPTERLFSILYAASKRFCENYYF